MPFQLRQIFRFMSETFRPAISRQIFRFMSETLPLLGDSQH
jgi:hypothetical protein